MYDTIIYTKEKLNEEMLSSVNSDGLFLQYQNICYILTFFKSDDNNNKPDIFLLKSLIPVEIDNLHQTLTKYFNINTETLTDLCKCTLCYREIINQMIYTYYGISAFNIGYVSYINRDQLLNNMNIFYKLNVLNGNRLNN